MNELIEKLAEIVISQNESEWPDFREVMTGAGALYLHVFSEKFAELIVEECIEILSKNNPCPPGTTIMYSLIQDEYFDKGWQVAVETKSNQIKEHFRGEE